MPATPRKKSKTSLDTNTSFTKSPKGQDLEHLWHIAKYNHIAFTLATGALNVISIQKIRMENDIACRCCRLRGWGAGLEIFISNVEESKLGRVGMILKEEIEERYSRLVGEMFSNAVRDIKRIPERVQPGQRRVLLMNEYVGAIFGSNKTKSILRIKPRYSSLRHIATPCVSS